jgi:hypothetical protein
MCTGDVIVGMNEISDSKGKNKQGNKTGLGPPLKRPFRCEVPTSAMSYH